jgi:hypothetical protein
VGVKKPLKMDIKTLNIIEVVEGSGTGCQETTVI